MMKQMRPALIVWLLIALVLIAVLWCGIALADSSGYLEIM